MAFGCRLPLLTGEGFAKRTLDTDAEDFVFKPQGTGGLTGINLVVTAPDLLDRAFIYRLERIPEEERSPEAQLYERLDTLKPRLLGAMFKALSESIQVIHERVPKRVSLPPPEGGGIMPPPEGGGR